MIVRTIFLAIFAANFFNLSHGVVVVTNATSSKDGVFYFKNRDEFAEFPEIPYEEELNIFCYNGAYYFSTFSD